MEEKKKLELCLELIRVIAKKSCYSYSWFEDDGYSCDNLQHPNPKSPSEWCTSCKARALLKEMMIN